MRLPRFMFVIGVMACAAEPEEVSVGSSETGSSSSTTAMTTSSSSVDTTSAVDSSSSSTTEPATTGVPNECGFEPTIDEVLDSSDPDPIDCGAVTLDDNAVAWKAARDCARDATLDQLPYKVLWQYSDAGTLRDAAFALGNGSGTTIYRFDDDMAEGTSSLTVTVCSGISTPTACTPSPGEICIECIEPGEPSELCD